MCGMHVHQNYQGERLSFQERLQCCWEPTPSVLVNRMCGRKVIGRIYKLLTDFYCKPWTGAEFFPSSFRWFDSLRPRPPAAVPRGPGSAHLLLLGRGKGSLGEETWGGVSGHCVWTQSGDTAPSGLRSPPTLLEKRHLRSPSLCSHECSEVSSW